MKNLIIGPFLGDIEKELIQFRPYARWLVEVAKYDKVYISTHINRSFLYDFVPTENIIPVYQHLSRDEENQNGYVHKTINKRDYNLIVKKLKEEIIERENCTKRDIEHHNLSYTKNYVTYSIFNKIFEKIPNIDLKIPKKHENKIVFIPSKTESLKKTTEIYNWLRRNNDIIVIGNKDIWDSEDNSITKRIDYFENGMLYCLKYIMKSKCIICPSSYWTFIANLQNKSVFSWGNDISLYKEDGIYNFGNKKCFTIPTSNDTNINIIINSIKYFLERKLN